MLSLLLQPVLFQLLAAVCSGLLWQAWTSMLPMQLKSPGHWRKLAGLQTLHTTLSASAGQFLYCVVQVTSSSSAL
jgi:hypothetical protein